MSRGYTYVTYDDQVVKSVTELDKGTQVKLHFQDGQADAEIKKNYY